MPVTPLHIGIPGLFSYRWPHRVDIVAAILGSGICDVDFFLMLAFGHSTDYFIPSRARLRQRCC